MCVEIFDFLFKEDKMSASHVNVTEMIRKTPKIIALRDKMRAKSKRYSANQLKAVMEAWKKKHNCNLYIQWLDRDFDVPNLEDMKEAVSMTGTSSEEYKLPDNDCQRYAARCKGLLEVMLSDPKHDFNGASTVGRFNDFAAKHSFIIAIVLDDKAEPMVVFFEPQSDQEIKVTNDPKSIYTVDGSAEVEFG